MKKLITFLFATNIVIERSDSMFDIEAKLLYIAFCLKGFILLTVVCCPAFYFVFKWWKLTLNFVWVKRPTNTPSGIQGNTNKFLLVKNLQIKSTCDSTRFFMPLTQCSTSTDLLKLKFLSTSIMSISIHNCRHKYSLEKQKVRTMGPPFPEYTPVGVHTRCSTLDLYKKLGEV